jgi:hypothetical protein
MVGDAHGSSDPFIVYSFCGKPLGTTRVRPRSTNPRWDNETFIVPMDENLPAPRHMPQSQKDLVRLEVYDHDWVTNNEFLGHVEITRSKLMKIAAVSNQLPIRLPLTMKEYHGFVNLQFGYDENFLHVKVVRAENVNMVSATALSNPYVKVYLGNSCLVGTTTTLSSTINPHWYNGNVFKIKMLQFLFAERYALSQIDAFNETQERLARTRGDTSRQYQSGSASQLMDEFSSLPTNLALFRVELYHDNRWRRHQLLGKAYISVHKLRKMLPTLPAADIANMNGFAEYAVNTAKVDQASAKLQAAEAASGGSGWLSCFDCCGKRRQRSRPGSPDAQYAGAVGRAPSAVVIASNPGSVPAASAGRRRGNLLGAASAGGATLAGVAIAPAAVVSEPPSAQSSPINVASGAPSPVPFPPSVRPAPPPMTLSAQSDAHSFGVSSKSSNHSDSGGNITLELPAGLSNRRRRPPPPSGSFRDFSQKSSPEAAPETSPSKPEEELTSGSAKLSASSASQAHGDLEHGLAGSSASQSHSHSHSQLPSAVSGGSLHSALEGGSLVSAGLAAGSLASVDSWEQPVAFPAGDIEQAQQQTDAVVYEPHKSSRPAPPPLSTIIDNSSAMSPENSLSVSTKRAPFLRDAENSSNTLLSRKSKRSLLSLSFRAPASETVWSESYPFPIMLDLGAHRGVDALGNPVSQGFIVLRLIPATRGTVVLGLDEAVRQMTLGETAHVKCRFDYAYGSFSMGSSIPPRANVIFKVQLLELNGRGRYQVLYRQFLRFMRWFTRTYAAGKRYFYGEEEEYQGHVQSKKLKRQASFSVRLMQSLGLSSKAGTKGSDSESSEESESEEENEEEALLNGANAEGTGFDEGSEDGSSVDSTLQHRVKPDPRMRKHLNPSVQSGAQLMWNFKPPQKVKKAKPATVKKGTPLYPTKQLAPVSEKEDGGDDAEEKRDSDWEGGADQGDFGDGGSEDEGRNPLHYNQQRPGGGGYASQRHRMEGVDYDDGRGLDGAGRTRLGSALEGDDQDQEDRNESDDDAEYRQEE